MCKPTCVPTLLRPKEEGKEKCIKKLQQRTLQGHWEVEIRKFRKIKDFKKLTVKVFFKY